MTFERVIWFATIHAQSRFRVIGIGTTIAVEFPNEVMRAYEPFEFDKVGTANLPMRLRDPV